MYIEGFMNKPVMSYVVIIVAIICISILAIISNNTVFNYISLVVIVLLSIGIVAPISNSDSPNIKPKKLDE
jgi:peptidoglycan/LPS O-acetylase OafA/YrhL